MILIFDYWGLLKPLRGFFEEKLVVPLRMRFTGPLSSQILDASDYCQEKDLEITSLKAQIAALKSENLSSKKLLGAPLVENWKFLSARVIGGTEDELIIDKGQKEGINKGMMVLTEGFFLGKVEKVSQEMATVRLLSSPESKTVVKIIDKESLILVGKGLLIGNGEGKMEIREILAEEDAKEEDLVVALGSSETVDLPVGKVAAITFKKGDVFKTARVLRQIKVRDLENVFLVIGRM